MDLSKGHHFPLGVSLTDDGANFAVHSEIADAVEVCLFSAEGEEERVELPGRTAHVFHGMIPGVSAGQRYGYESMAHGSLLTDCAVTRPSCSSTRTPLLLKAVSVGVKKCSVTTSTILINSTRWTRPQRCRAA
jgi:hypothetical protein